MRYKYSDVVRDGNGVIVIGATVAVYLTGTTNVASVYTAASGGTAVNSVTSGDDGAYTFYIDPSDYSTSQGFDLYISADGYEQVTETSIYIVQPDKLVTLADTQTLTNKTLTSPVLNTPVIDTATLNTSVSGTAVDTTSTLGTSATKVASQGAIKHYTDRIAKVSAQRYLASQIFS